MKNKKAQERKLISTIVLWAVASMIIFGIAASIYFFYLNKSPEDKCKISVVTRYRAKLLGNPIPVQLACSTRHIEIKKDGAHLDGRKRAIDYPDFSQGALEENIKRAIAEEGFICAKEFLQGTADPWGDWGVATKVHCVRCSDISFSQDIQAQYPKINGFTEFLNNKKIPAIGKTYTMYLTNDGAKEVPLIDLENTDRTYSWVFMLRDVGAGGYIASRTAAGCGAAAGATWLFNIIPVGGQIAYGSTTLLGCVAGFSTSTWHYFVGDEKIELQSHFLLIPREEVADAGCHQMY